MPAHPAIALTADAFQSLALTEQGECCRQRALELHTGTAVGAGNFFGPSGDKEVREVQTGPLPPCRCCHGTCCR
jgi:hypothetical protein